MLATLIFNGSILITLILLPLIYPDALPSHMLPSLLVAPEAPKPETPTKPIRIQPAQAHNHSELDHERIIAPPIIPRTPFVPSAPELRFRADSMNGDNGPGVIGGTGNSIFSGHPVTVVQPPVPSSIHLSSKLVEGMLIYKSIPQYPSIAKAARVEGTVILQATIARTGTIENLRVISGPAMLQQAAIDAVRSWRYRPYLLNQQPVEVETTVNVIFKLDR
jgi:protein TonB